ncbi:MAG: hypothetical protein HY318_10470, partial [Armatimonadetes bacterium]|nr:hypothetical protein [Armatimonadota bacterium]
MFRELIVVSLLVAVTGAAHAGDDSSIGPGSRLFVTKVHPGHGRLTEQDFRQLADAGFTVAVDRWIEDVDGFCAGASRVGLAAMTWQMGMADAIEGDNVDRTMTRLGKPTRFTLPFSEAGWAKVTKEIVAQAQLSLKYPNLKGALLDFEIYDENRTDGFCESYDDATFISLHRELGKPVPTKLPAAVDRRAYLDKLQVLSLYVEFQAKQVGVQARKLRMAVDAVNPRFQIGVYGWGAFKESVMRNVASEKAPVINLDATLYGRTTWSNAFEGGYDANEPDRTGLKWSLVTASEMARAARQRDYPEVLLAGHYPQSPGPRDGLGYKFTVRQSFNSAAYADGYWIWTDWWLPEPWTDKQAWIDAMMVYWKEANAALDAGDFTWSSRQPDAVPNPKATTPEIILTTDGTKVVAWEALTGQRLSITDSIVWPKKNGPVMLGTRSLHIEGWNVKAKGGDLPVVSFPVGHATRAVAVGEVDGIEGDELVTLNAGWVKIWDPASQS